MDLIAVGKLLAEIGSQGTLVLLLWYIIVISGPKKEENYRADLAFARKEFLEVLERIRATIERAVDKLEGK